MSEQNGISCPTCGGVLSRITDTRLIENGKRRRRICHHCDTPYFTVEAVEGYSSWGQQTLPDRAGAEQ